MVINFVTMGRKIDVMLKVIQPGCIHNVVKLTDVVSSETPSALSLFFIYMVYNVVRLALL